MKVNFLPYMKYIFDREHVADLKKDFVVVVLDAELITKFPQNWIVLRHEKNKQYGSFIPDYS